jgi:HTH-type transcriptional regulator / antitoxin HigA
MDMAPIRTESDYEAALKEIEAYFGHEPEPGTKEADRFDVLSALIGAYEQRHWPITAPDDRWVSLRSTHPTAPST